MRDKRLDSGGDMRTRLDGGTCAARTPECSKVRAILDIELNLVTMRAPTLFIE